MTALAHPAATAAAPRWRRGLMCVLITVLLGVGGAAVARAWGLTPMRVTTGSMDPALSPGDWFAATALGEAGRRTVGWGDMVVFRYPIGSTGRAIKRVVAVSGDRVTVSATAVTIDGHAIPAPALESGPAGPSRTSQTVPAGHVFLLGDNAAASYDSRAFGPVPVTELVGRVRLVVPGWWPRALAAALICLLAGLGLATVRWVPRRAPARRRPS